MKTLHIENIYYKKGSKDLFEPGQSYFIIGVKGLPSQDIYELVKFFPKIKIDKVFPEGKNPKYLQEDSHILQPAFISYKFPKEKSE